MCTADKDSQFWRGTSPPAPSSLDSKLKWLARLRTLNEHQRKVIWSQHDMRDKRNNSISTLKSNNVSFPLNWSANNHALWIHWCLRMINQLMWHLSWNPSGLLTDSIFEMQLPSLTRVLHGLGLVLGSKGWVLFKRGQGFVTQVISSISLESMLPKSTTSKKKNTQWGKYTLTFKMGLQRL